ncbi:MAG TPA: hypothetical protein VE988_28980 [Gemmataceae bacterium]|nr:hypothetical protein [Gemmataceae bacterium]
MADEPKPYRPRCIYFTCKSLQVFGEDFESDPDYQAGVVEFMCTRTFHCHGPDGSPVQLDICSDPARTCFRAY